MWRPDCESIDETVLEPDQEAVKEMSQIVAVLPINQSTSVQLKAIQ